MKTPINLDVSKLKPCINEKTFSEHYNSVYDEHIEKFNQEKVDYAFHKAGIKLHELYFENIRSFKENNIAYGKSLELIQYRYGSWDNFVQTMYDQAERLQGSGWLFMNHAGYVNIIPNNRLVENVAMIIDLWEHAYFNTHGNDRNKYLKTHFGIINWDVVNARLLKGKSNEKV